MPSNARQYRDHLHQHRSHPNHGSEAEPTLSKSRSFRLVHLSLVPLLVLEYYLEREFAQLPSGIAFPVGFFFLWAFYFTYYRPGFLEEQLSGEKKWEVNGIPAVLMGSLIWLVKVIFVELTENLLIRGLGLNGKKGSAKKHSRPRPSAPPPRQPASPATPSIPREVSRALGILGIPDCNEWAVVQRRYRELAKQTHPDLNPEITQAGKRFILIDAAYRQLLPYKGKIFR